MDHFTIEGGMLHDTVEDTDASINDIKSDPVNEYSSDIEDILIEQVSSIKWLPASKDGKNVGISFKIIVSFDS